MEEINIICMKWGTKYGPEYVNTLYSMVSRNIKLPFRFICLTDDNIGFVDGIESFAIPKLNIPNGPERGWDKLLTFTAPLYDLKGQALYLDLDIVIIDNIDCFFEFPAQFPIIKDWVKKDVTGNSSVYRFSINQHADILANFKENHQQIRKQVRNEQEYLSQYVAKQQQLTYWPENWCQSFKYNCIKKGWAGWFIPPELPFGAKIIIFHGKPNPPDAIMGRSGKWYRKVLPTTWVADHWQ